MNYYVLGFIFSPDFKDVLLIRKNKPENQAGKLNGIGGKVEDGETSHEAMVREGEEETGLNTDSWNYFITFGNNKEQWRVSCFYTVNPNLSDIAYKAPREEGKLGVFSTENETGRYYYAYENRMANLRWLIPMAINHGSGLEDYCTLGKEDV